MIFWKLFQTKSSNTQDDQTTKYTTISKQPSKGTSPLCHAPSEVAHGYLGAILTAAEYAAATPVNTPPFTDPIFPGDAAVISPNSTGPQIAAIK